MMPRIRASTLKPELALASTPHASSARKIHLTTSSATSGKVKIKVVNQTVGGVQITFDKAFADHPVAFTSWEEVNSELVSGKVRDIMFKVGATVLLSLDALTNESMRQQLAKNLSWSRLHQPLWNP
jgi:hypothetical protein